MLTNYLCFSHLKKSFVIKSIIKSIFLLVFVLTGNFPSTTMAAEDLLQPLSQTKGLERIVVGDDPNTPALSSITSFRLTSGSQISVYEIDKGIVLFTENAPNRQAAKLNHKILALRDPQKIFQVLVPNQRVPDELRRVASDWRRIDLAPRDPRARSEEFKPLLEEDKIHLNKFGVPRSILDRRINPPVIVRPGVRTFVPTSYDLLKDNSCPYIDWFNAWAGIHAKYNYTCVSGNSVYSGTSYLKGVAAWFAVSPESPQNGFNHTYVGMGKVIRPGSLKKWIYIRFFNDDMQYFSWSLNASGTPTKVGLASIAIQDIGFFDHAIYNNW
ncbi:MAG: hypothetical protein HQK51_17010 [Oligoflexia bacterium]|nr:hypothetical protein [Oligoflexia bacterium]